MFRKKVLGLICLLLLSAKESPAELTNGLYAAFDTSMGSFTCRLDYAETPLTCANFVGLAEGTHAWLDATDPTQICQKPFYNGLLFHRVIDGFMIQSGCPLGTGMGGPGYSFPDEFAALRHDKPGILSMANSGPDSNGSQFFITVEPTSWLDGHHTVFGEVIEDGMVVVSNINQVATDENSRPVTDVEINQIRIIRIGEAAEAFDAEDQPLPTILPLNLSISNAPTGRFVASVSPGRSKQMVYERKDLVYGSWNSLTNGYWQEREKSGRLPLQPISPLNFSEASASFIPKPPPTSSPDTL
jgi:cyclophilin family peptidyl-prolyl cis-trans isomerase